MPYETPHQLESEIRELEERLAERKQTLSEQREPESERATIREYVGEKIAGAVPPPNITVPPTTGQASGGAPTAQEEALKVQELVDVAFLKGLGQAIGAVKASHNARLIDAFHDALVDHLYNDLVSRGKLKPI
ncbi:hypothetical protein HYZ80_03165 [Candidatus Parcubacteria bacterium]|nr:hypothetical protein [Candidatus Parcubacteria bacterium]